MAPDSRINLLRITIPNQANKLKPGMPAIVKIKTTQRHALNIPTDAVIRERNGASVWLKTGEYSFRSQMVHTGLKVMAPLKYCMD